MKNKPIKINYDQPGDVLYIIFGENKPSYAEQLADGVYARHDMETDELTGITITSFSQQVQTDLINLISLQDVSKEEIKNSFEMIQ